MTRLDVEHDDRVVSFVLDGNRHNALDRERYQALERAARTTRADQVLLVRSEGEHFCAGQDLDEWRARDGGAVSSVLRTGAAAVAAVMRCQGPVVVLAQGAAVGAGALLVAAADVAVVTENASLRLPELDLGLPLGASIARQLLPAPLVRRMLFAGERVDAARLGTVGAARVVPDGDLAREGDRIVRRILDLDVAASRTARALWDADTRECAGRAYEREVAACVRLLDTTDSPAGVHSMPPGWWPG